MIETLYINSRGQITIPSNIRKSLRLKEGSVLVVTKLDNKIVMHPTYSPDKDILSLYNSVKVKKGKTRNIDIAIEEAKRLKAIDDAK